MKATSFRSVLAPLTLAVLGTLAGSSQGAVFVQCPGDANSDAMIDDSSQQTGGVYNFPSDARCMHVSGGDGFVTMADGRPLYMFGFSDLTGIPEEGAMSAGHLAAAFPAPKITLDEGDEFYLGLTNVGMLIRPDLFDPHTVHYHGFPQAASIFDGVPESSLSINAGATLTYYYSILEPGTFMYHCHVEATEHMQMGMLGNLYVRPAQNRLPDGTPLGSHVHSNPDYDPDRNQDDPLVGDTYVYNDSDGSTRYDVEAALQLGSFDAEFHDASWNVQPLPFAEMLDTYPMINGRGYPDTVEPGALPAPEENGYQVSQFETSLIEADAGERILLRFSNLSVTNFFSVTALGLPMKVVGQGARIRRGGGEVTGADLYYQTSSVTLGGGEAVDVIVDTAGLPPGTYFMYATNMNFLSNDTEDYGGMMTEIVLN